MLNCRPHWQIGASETFGLEASALRDLELRDAQDIKIFEAAPAENVVIMTKTVTL
jgi:predicted nuclease of predicted toxin-antitoxin system